MSKSVGFKKNMSTFSLMMTGITSILGSGWLLATQKISNIAGPAGILAWVIGMVVAILIALFCIEVGTANPSAGGIGSYSVVTHGRFSGFLTQWVNWLSVLAVPAVEAQAIVQYLSKASPYFTGWYDMHNHVLSATGIFMAILLMIFFLMINFWGLTLFIRFNNLITVIKILIPLLTIFCLFMSGFHKGDFGHNVSQFAPYGYSSIGYAVISCGVIMSFNGFQLPLNFSEEINNPKRQLPIAIIGSILVTFVIYLLLQIVFIAGVDPAKLIHGWQGVNYRSPYVELLLAANLHLMSLAVMSTSAIAPAACGGAFIASGSRILYNLSRSRQLPGALGQLDEKYHSPRAAIIVNTVLGCIFLFMFKGWAQLVAVISALHVFSYISTPVVAVSYRNLVEKQPELSNKNQFKLPFIKSLSLVVMFVLAVLMFLSGFATIKDILFLLIPGILFFFYYDNKSNNSNLFEAVKKGSWIIFFIVGLTVICYLGDNKEPHAAYLTMPVCIVLLAILSCLSYTFGIKSAKI